MPCTIDDDKSESRIIDEPDDVESDPDFDRGDKQKDSTSSTPEPPDKNIFTTPDPPEDNLENDRTGGTGNSVRTDDGIKNVKDKDDLKKLESYPLTVVKKITATFNEISNFKRVKVYADSSTNPTNTEILSITEDDAAGEISVEIKVSFLEPEGSQKTPIKYQLKTFFYFGSSSSSASGSVLISTSETKIESGGPKGKSGFSTVKIGKGKF